MLSQLKRGLQTSTLDLSSYVGSSSSSSVPCIAVLTSGGDSQGMNAAVRAVVRSSLSRGCRVFGILEGYAGLTQEPAPSVIELRWSDVSGVLQLGGTILGSARCAAMLTREGLKRAARVLARLDVAGLVVIGGDGSLTGAEVLRTQYGALCEELRGEGQLAAGEGLRPLLVVGLVGSIDNDMAGFDMTIGADSALHRIVEAVDAITSTALSHQRTFVIEVMGRNCGWLALAAALATGAACVFIPEAPPRDAWQADLLALVQAARRSGKRASLILVCEGAIDAQGRSISAHCIAELLTQSGIEARLTILGHVQRGGHASAYDRLMSTMLGVAAVDVLLGADPAAAGAGESLVLGAQGLSIAVRPLTVMVQRVKDVAALVRAREYDGAMRLRGEMFCELWRLYQQSVAAPAADAARRPGPGAGAAPGLLVMHAGSGSPGMNSVVRAAVRFAMQRGFQVSLALDGFEGLLEDRIVSAEWMTVHGWAAMAGVNLGTSRVVPSAQARVGTAADALRVAAVLARLNVRSVLVVGGFDGVPTLRWMRKMREEHAAFCVPMALLPATIANNVPGSDISVGVDTALNTIVRAVDNIKSTSTSRRTYLVEVMGGGCGYLPLVTGIATGAEFALLPEDGVDLRSVTSVARELRERFAVQTATARTLQLQPGPNIAVGILTENISQFYNADTLARLLSEEGSDDYSVRTAMLGHVQQGGFASPSDRVLAVRLAHASVEWLVDQLAKGRQMCAVMGELEGKIEATDLDTVVGWTDFGNRRPKVEKWLHWRVVGELTSGSAFVCNERAQGGHVGNGAEGMYSFSQLQEKYRKYKADNEQKQSKI